MGCGRGLSPSLGSLMRDRRNLYIYEAPECLDGVGCDVGHSIRPFSPDPSQQAGRGSPGPLGRDRPAACAAPDTVSAIRAEARPLPQRIVTFCRGEGQGIPD